MTRMAIARELTAVAKDLTALEFSNPAALDKYMRDHPGSKRTDHVVKKNPIVKLPGKKKPFLKLPSNHPGRKKPFLKLPSNYPGRKKSSEDIAHSLVMVAREMISATKDLAEIRAVLPALRKKQEEMSVRQEQERQEMNQLYNEATRDLRTKTEELVRAIQKELNAYFGSNGMGIRRSDAPGNLLEVFLGSKDGVKRYQSKVSVHIAMTFKGSETFSYMLRNEDLDDMRGELANKGTIPKLMRIVKKADKVGFWAGGEL